MNKLIEFSNNRNLYGVIKNNSIYNTKEILSLLKETDVLKDYDNLKILLNNIFKNYYGEFYISRNYLDEEYKYDFKKIIEIISDKLGCLDPLEYLINNYNKIFEGCTHLKMLPQMLKEFGNGAFDEDLDYDNACLLLNKLKKDFDNLKTKLSGVLISKNIATSVLPAKLILTLQLHDFSLYYLSFLKEFKFSDLNEIHSNLQEVITDNQMHLSVVLSAQKFIDRLYLSGINNLDTHSIAGFVVEQSETKELSSPKLWP